MSVVVPEVISLANSILVHVGLPRRVLTLKQCNTSLFSQLYETLTGCRVPSLSLQAPTSEAVKCQAVIDALNVHLHPHVTLDHIQGSDIAQLDIISIKNLLDIFSVLFHVPPPTEDSYDDVDSYSDGSHDALVDGGRENAHNDVANESNVISSEGMSVISEVLREELGHSSHSTVTDSTTELVNPVPMARLPAGITKTTVQTQLREDSSVGTQSNGSSATTTNSQPPSLTISSLHSTSTEESRVISHVRETPQAVESTELTNVNTKLATVILSGESSIGTTPSPMLYELHTPPQSPRQSQHQRLSPLHHSTPHTSTRSRLFPISTSTSTAVSSNFSSHPLTSSTAAVTPSVTVTHQQRTQVGTKSSKERVTDPADQSTLTTITTDDGNSTLVPDSPPPPQSSPGHSTTCSRPIIPDLTITDLHTTTMSSMGEGAVTATGPVDPRVHVATQSNSSEDSDSGSSSSADTETPPPELRHSTTQPVHLHTRTPQTIAASAAQKVRFSHSTEQRERARHGSSLTSESSVGQSGIEVGDISSIQLKLGLDAQVAQSRASVLATLYQNYLKELKTAQPVTKEAPKAASKRAGAGNKSKHKSYPRKRSKPVAPKQQHKRVQEGPPSESSGEESDPECEQRPPTPTKFAVGDNMFPLIEREFPFIHVSPSTVHRLRQKQLQQVTALTKPKLGQKTSAVKKMAEMEQKQKALLQIIKKELDHTKRLQCQLEQQREKVAVKSSIRAKRQAAARAKRYYHDYELQLKAKLQRRRTREELIFKRTFEEGLELQRERIRELKRYAKERQEQHAKIHQDQLDSMENYYRDQLAMLSESMLKERRDCTIRDKAQNQMVQKMKRELRQKIESEIQELQQCLVKEEDVVHFRELDSQNVRHKLSRMAFTTTVK